MHGLFNYNGVFVQTCNKIADGICLSMLWLISSLPVFTMGAATTALSYSVNKCIRRSEGGVWSAFWHGFRTNFRQATGLWLLLLLVYSLAGICCYSAYLMCASGNLPGEMLWFLMAVTALVTVWSSFLFPYLAKFRNSSPAILKNCLFIAIMHFPVGLLHLFLLLASIAAVVIFPLSILCAPGIYMVLSCYALETVFRKYMSEEDRVKEETLDQDL